MVVIEYDPIDNQQMALVWALFMDSGEMERILGCWVRCRHCRQIIQDMNNLLAEQIIQDMNNLLAERH
jgi:hypothetical protein